MSRTAEIKVTVELDAENLPTGIEWQATESRETGATPCQSMLLSLWDSESKTTAAIDLWTKDMTVEDMNLYFYQVIHKMADSYLRATQNSDISNLIHEFGNGFGTRLGLVGPDNEAGLGDIPVDLVSLADDDGSRSTN